MINMQEVLETNNMIAHEKLDVRTITMGISLLDCVDSDLAKMNGKIYNKITTYAKDLVSTEIRLLTIGTPNSRPMASPVDTRSFA